MAASTRSAFTSGLRAPLANARRAAVRPARRQQCVSVRAMIREYPDPDFIAETLAEFPDKGVANVEEARVSASDFFYY